MSLSQKDFYFLTDRSTLFRYFVDNSSGKSKRYIFYPRKYEQMTDKQIIKYERKLNINFLWWAIRNKSKMAPYDYSICRSHVVDGMFIVLSTLVLARLARITLFRH